MALPRTASPFLRFLRRHVSEVLAALYLLHLLYTALLPFDFTRSVAQQHSTGTWWGLQITAPHLPDVASNIALYVPLGILVRAALVKHGAGKHASLVPTVAAAALLSYAAEYIQQYSPTRVCAASDFLCNVVGAAAGAAASNVLVTVGRRFAARNRRDLRECPSAVLARLTALALAATALIPFDVTFTVNRFHAALLNACVIPFQKLQNVAAVAENVSAHPGANDAFNRLRDWWMLLLDYVGYGVGYAVLAVIVAYYLRRHCKTSIWRTATWTVASCTILAAITCAVQTFILSRGLDTSYLVLGTFGATFGVAAHGLLLRYWGAAAEPGSEARLRRHSRILAAAVAAMAFAILLRETVPFRPVCTIESIFRQAQAADWLPMEAYLQARLPVATDDLMHKLLRFALLGGLISLCRLTRPDATPTKAWRPGLHVAAAIAVLELGQLLLPSRIPGLTDVLIAGVGTAGGVHVHRLAFAYYAEVRTRRPDRTVNRIRYDVELGPPGEGVPERPWADRRADRPDDPARGVADH